MAGAVTEILTIAGLLDHVARGLVHLPAAEYLPISKRALDAADGRIASSCHDCENITIPGRHLAPNEGGPGQVAVHRTRLIELAPQIDEDKVPFTDYTVRSGHRLVVRIAAMRSDRTDRSVIRHQSVRLEVLEDALLHFGFMH